MIEFVFSGFDEPVSAVLLSEPEPAYAERLWEHLATPMRMWSWHPTSSGDWCSCKARPSRTRPSPALQIVSSVKPKLMCDTEQGSIIYSGAGVFSFAYGPHVTEPLPSRAPPAARATDLRLLYEAGRYVWDSHYRRHEQVIVTARRKDAQNG